MKEGEKESIYKFVVRAGAVGLSLLALTGCVSGQESGTVSVTKTPEVAPGKEKDKKVSPEVVCSAPNPNQPNWVGRITFTKIRNNVMDMEMRRDNGQGMFRPNPDGSLNPIGDYVRTGLIGVKIPYGRTEKGLVEKDLGGCLVLKKDQPVLQEFFKDMPEPRFENNGLTETNRMRRVEKNPFAGRAEARFIKGGGSKPSWGFRG